MSRPELPAELEVYVNSLDEQGRVTYISGYFEFRKQQLKFTAIGMEGYGGPNIAATLSDDTLLALRKIGLDDEAMDELITGLQRKIMEGQAHMQISPNTSQGQDVVQDKKTGPSAIGD
ncbi:MAG TPA: hypothetical protein VLV31_07980 [Candidatus Acidoferrales bacterium]|nr:hypothetical protein [Candidatus Acidoferrales bacterium]